MRIKKEEIDNLLDQMAMLRKQVGQTIQFAADESVSSEDFVDSYNVVKKNFKFIYDKIESFKAPKKEKYK